MPQDAGDYTVDLDLTGPVVVAGDEHWSGFRPDRIKAAGNPEKDIASSLRLRDNVRRVLVVKDRPEWKTKKA